MSFICSAPDSATAGRVRQQRHLARVLDRLGDLTLLLDGDAGDAAGTDLATVGDELPQQRGVLVIDVGDAGSRERVALLLRLPDNGLGHDAPAKSGATIGQSEGGLFRRAAGAAPGVAPGG